MSASAVKAPHRSNTDSVDKEDGALLEDSMRRLKIQDWVRQQLATRYEICNDLSAAFGIMHRLDAQTSGALLCAKSYMGARWIKMQWCFHDVVKEYICLVHGPVDTRVMSVRKRIAKEADKANLKKSPRCFVSELGRPAHTELTILAHLRGMANAARDAADAGDEEHYSLVALKIHTGRTHQIRVHMKAIGHPLIRDKDYAELNFLADCTWCPRNFLHTYHFGCRDLPENSNRS